MLLRTRPVLQEDWGRGSETKELLNAKSDIENTLKDKECDQKQTTLYHVYLPEKNNSSIVPGEKFRSVGNVSRRRPNFSANSIGDPPTSHETLNKNEGQCQKRSYR